jgi:hypothetical protein
MPGFDSLHNNLFFNEGLPVFSSVERALNTYSKVLRYQKWERSVRF